MGSASLGVEPRAAYPVHGEKVCGVQPSDEQLDEIDDCLVCDQQPAALLRAGLLLDRSPDGVEEAAHPAQLDAGLLPQRLQ